MTRNSRYLLVTLFALTLSASGCKKPTTAKTDNTSTTPKAAELPSLEVKADSPNRF